MSRIASTSKFSLEDYDLLLSPLESNSIATIESSNTKSFSTKLANRFESTKKQKSIRVDSPNSNSPRFNSSSLALNKLNDPTTDSINITSPIETSQQFHDWFTKVGNLIEQDQETIYRTHLTQLEEYLGICQEILNELEESRGLLSEMEANYKFVEENSKALQSACETMLDEQKHLVEVSEAIGNRLEYFKELELVTKMLNLPGEDLVLQDDFLNMLDRLDICLDYLKLNRDFKDAEIYIIRFQQCLTRSMTLIKMYFVSVLKKLSNEVVEKMMGKELSDVALDALLYKKFSSTALSLRVLMIELEKRALINSLEYGNLLAECYYIYFNIRNSLILNSLTLSLSQMNPVSSDLIKLARAGCNHLRSICVQEFNLYKQFFSTGQTELYQYLESLCDYLYDSLRPKILHELKIEILCELSTILSAMMALDSKANLEDLNDSDEEEDNNSIETIDVFENSNSIKSEKISTELGKLKFSVLLKVILQDVQTRLVFRAQGLVQLEVLNYLPTGDEINYPEVLELKEGEEREEEKLCNEEEGEKEGGFRVPREEGMINWFITLRKTVWVLSKLHTYVNDTIFEDFAGEAVTACRQSLSAAAILVTNRDGNTQLDGQLFLIRHLLLLKEMIQSVDLGRVERGVDFSSVTDALYNLLRNTSVILNPNALYALASRGIPNFAETMIDAKLDLDGALKKACESFITETASLQALPISNFLALCTTFLSSATPKDLATQEFATPTAVILLHDNLLSSLESEEGIKRIVKKLKVYLVEEKTIKVLLPPLLEEIVEVYTTFYNLVRSEYDFSTSSSLTTPSLLKEKLTIATI